MAALVQSGAEEMRLTPGERIWILRSGERKDVGREPLLPAHIELIAAEAGVGEDSAEVSRRLPIGGAEIEIEREKGPGGSSLIIRRTDTVKAPASSERVPELLQMPEPAAVEARFPIDHLLTEMIGRNASDLHLSSGAPPGVRVHGEMVFLPDRSDLTTELVEGLLTPIFTSRAREDFREKSDADFAYEIEGLARFRVNVFRDRKGVGAVFRQIPIEIVPAEKLGLSKAVLDLCYLTKGLVVVTGPTGSGKSTTLASMVNYINRNRTDHIITIEDPIEFVHPNVRCLVNQREVGTHTRSFKDALRAALREDPDIVLVGEMRDLETIAIAIETAETGHLVFGTLHTTTAISTIDRIIDQFPAGQQNQVRVMLADSLKGVIAQVLCRRKEGGRVAALEVLLASQAVSSLIREGKTFQIASVIQTSRSSGMIAMNDALLDLVKADVIEPKEAWLKATDKTSLVAAFKTQGFPSQFS